MRGLLVAFILITIEGFAQEEVWYPGVLVTPMEEVLTGDLMFYPLYDVVVVRQKDQIKVLNSTQVKSFRYYDRESNINRKFISVTSRDMASNPRIYEVVVAGEISVIRVLKRTAGPSPSDDRDGYQYFFLDNGNLQPLEKFNKQLYPSIRNWLIEEEKQLHLSRNNIADAIRYISLYNQKILLLALH